MKRNLVFLTLLCIFSLSALYSYTVYENLSENLLRLHIVANSNSDYDQRIKLMVRDEIIKSTKSLPQPQTAMDTANNVLDRLGADYGAKASFEWSFVPAKEYKNVRLPEGEYTCLKVILGEGLGENWWCIAYPPLCFCEEVFGEMTPASMALLENRLDAESFRTIVNSGNVNFRFRIVEDFQKLKTYLEKEGIVL